MASEIKVDTIVNAGGDNDSGIDLSTNDIVAVNIAGAEKARVHSDGKVGIGVNDPDATLDISGGSNKLGILRVVQRASGASAYGLDVGLDPTTGDPVFSRIVNDTVTESFRIVRSSGAVTVGTTDSTPYNAPSEGWITALNDGTKFAMNLGATATDDKTVIRFQNPNGGIGGINTNGSATVYYTSSDYRLKENVVTDWGATTRLKQLKPSRFNFIADADTTVDGFLAHEVSDVVPEAITGTKDAVDADGNPEYQGIDQAKLVPLLTKALQEAVAKIETLEAKVTALESK